jgi:hypothetical protein
MQRRKLQRGVRFSARDRFDLPLAVSSASSASDKAMHLPTPSCQHTADPGVLVLRSRSTCKSRRRFDASLDSHWRTQDMRWRLEPRSTGRSLAAHAATAGCAGAAPSEKAYRNYCYTPTVTILSQWQPKHNLVTQQLGAQQPLFPRHHPAILPAQDFSLRINPAAPGKRPTKGDG